ncbi:MAG TPA: AI-2E family transporter [Burkholderiales bacterium]|nr:AI-2E family transporter [Burkholderiales bacterium]
MIQLHVPEKRDFPVLNLENNGVSATTLLLVLTVLAVLYTLYFARAVLLPIVMAILLALILTPAVRALRRLHIPRGLGAALVVAMLVACLGGIVGWIYDPAAQWIEKAPSTIAEMELKLRGVKKRVEEMAKVAEKVEQLAAPATAAKPRPVPAPAQGSLMQRTFSTTLTFLVTTGTTLVLLYFLLATSDLLMQKTLQVMSTREDRKRVVQIAREIESRMARYFGTVTLINAGLGIATGLAMFWLDMPNPVLWGVMAFAFNYFPYLGASASLIVLTVVAALTFDELRQVLLVPAVFFTFSVIEGQFLAPYIVGRHLVLNPVVVLLSMLFWAWLWGVVGALLAVPILVAFKIFCEHNDTLKPVGELLAGKAVRPQPAQLAPSP